MDANLRIQSILTQLGAIYIYIYIYTAAETAAPPVALPEQKIFMSLDEVAEVDSLNGLQKRKNQLTKTRRRSSANSAGSSASRPSLNERAKVARARAKTSTRARATSTRARSFLSATTSTGALVSEEVGQPGQARPGHLQTLPSVARFKPQTIIFGCHIVCVPNGHLEKL